MVKSICFTGHRHIAKEKLPAALAELRRVLETAIPQGFVDFYAGGALGWDTYCAQTVLDLREEYPCIWCCPVPVRSRRHAGQRRRKPPMTASIGRRIPVSSSPWTIPRIVCACGTSAWWSWRTAASVSAASRRAGAARRRPSAWHGKRASRLSIWHREIQKPRRRDVAFFAYGKGCSVPGSSLFISPEQQTEQPAHQRPDVEHL